MLEKTEKKIMFYKNNAKMRVMSQMMRQFGPFTVIIWLIYGHDLAILRIIRSISIKDIILITSRDLSSNIKKIMALTVLHTTV